jgi:hypothetical protein
MEQMWVKFFYINSCSVPCNLSIISCFCYNTKEVSSSSFERWKKKKKPETQGGFLIWSKSHKQQLIYSRIETQGFSSRWAEENCLHMVMSCHTAENWMCQVTPGNLCSWNQNPPARGRLWPFPHSWIVSESSPEPRSWCTFRTIVRKRKNTFLTLM